jgi:hypothetical protein
VRVVLLASPSHVRFFSLSVPVQRACAGAGARGTVPFKTDVTMGTLTLPANSTNHPLQNFMTVERRLKTSRNHVFRVNKPSPHRFPTLTRRTALRTRTLFSRPSLPRSLSQGRERAIRVARPRESARTQK